MLNEKKNQNKTHEVKYLLCKHKYNVVSDSWAWVHAIIILYPVRLA